MASIIGFNFDKINVEKNESVRGKIQINNNVTIKNVEQIDLNLGDSTQKGLKFFFEYQSTYDPGLAKIILGGNVLALEEEDKAKAIIDEWKKTKKLEKRLMEVLLNTILSKCNIQSLILSNTVNLPPPVPMPKVQVVDKSQQKQQAKPAEKKKKS